MLYLALDKCLAGSLDVFISFKIFSDVRGAVFLFSGGFSWLPIIHSPNASVYSTMGSLLGLLSAGAEESSSTVV